MPDTAEVKDLSRQEKLITRWHDDLSRQYPGLRLRWSRIYGSRWAHILGGGVDVAFFPVRLKLNQNFGLFIENPEILPQGELEKIIAQLKGEFN